MTLPKYTPILTFVKTHELAKLPSKNNPSDTGYDVYSVEQIVIPAGERKMVGVGLDFANIPGGYWLEPRSRSGLWFKHGIMVFNGVIDSGYTGEAGISLYNTSKTDYTVNVGDKIAQLVLHINCEVAIDWGVKITSSRGDKGFGSSGR